MCPTNLHYRRLTLATQLVAVALGALQAWNVRHTFDADGMSYLDLADAYLRGDWTATINGHWSPLYSWLLAFAMLLKPPPYWEFTLVHLVNFVIYVWTLFCFNLLLREVVRYNQSTIAASTGNEDMVLSPLAWLGLGYALFIASGLSMINIKSVSPDMVLAGFVYLATSILLRIYLGSAGWLTFVVLGAVLGAAYLTKAAMFPLAFIFLGTSMFAVGNLRRAIPRVLIALVVFLTIASPFIAALSFTKGRLTFGDSAKLAYAVYVNGITSFHWQGEPAGTGTPKHPTRRILDTPEIFEFATPIGGTYPLWYDPSYWHEGLVAHFEIKPQLWRVAANAIACLDVLTRSPILLIVGFVLYCVIASRSQTSMRSIAQNWVLLVPAVAAFAMYCFVLFVPRYLGPFFVLLCSGIACGVRATTSQESRRLLAQASIVMLAMLIVSIGSSTIQSLTREVMLRDSPPHLQWEVANNLSRMGLRAGDKVAFLGAPFFEYWARLARVKIVAEIPQGSAEKFWSAGPEVKSQVYSLLVKTGAKALVTNQRVMHASTEGWRQVGTTEYYMYPLQ